MIQINRRKLEYRYRGETMIQINRRKLEYRYSRGHYDINKQEETRIQIQPGKL